MFKISKKTLLVFVVIAIAFFFRIYNFQNLQYWSEDEELSLAFTRSMIVNHKISLVSHNYAINGPLGSFFHILSIPLFYLANMNPVAVLLLMSFLGLLTTYLIYKIGILIIDERVGLLAALIYATSFVISLADRRWWPLSLNPLLSALAIFSLLKILERKYIFLMPLAITIGFAFHADPTIAIIAFSSLAIFIFFRVPIFNRQLLYASVVLAVFLFPLLLFELKHPGSLTDQYSRTFISKSGGFSLTKNITRPQNPVTIISHIFFPRASHTAEDFLCYCITENQTIIPIISIPITILFLIYPLIKAREKNEKWKRIAILYIFLTTFFLTGVIYVIVFKNAIYDHYYTIIYPVFSLLAAITIYSFYNKKLIFIFLTAFYLLINFNTLLNSKLKYPLNDKKLLVDKVSDYLKSSNFSLYAPRINYIHNGGFTGLFTLDNDPPKTSYIYKYHDYMFTAYKLYPNMPDNKDQDKVVIVDDVTHLSRYQQNVAFKISVGNLAAVVIDNKEKYFTQKILEGY